MTIPSSSFTDGKTEKGDINIYPLDYLDISGNTVCIKKTFFQTFWFS